MTDGIKPTCTKIAVLNMPVKIFIVQGPMLDQTFIEYLFFLSHLTKKILPLNGATDPSCILNFFKTHLQ
jgi:hypothetical protein